MPYSNYILDSSRQLDGFNGKHERCFQTLSEYATGWIILGRTRFHLHSFTHPLIHSFIDSSTHPFSHSFLPSFIHSLIHSYIYLYMYHYLYFLYTYIHQRHAFCLWSA